MKKVILGTTLATSLLLVGGITASADVAMPEVPSVPFAVTITEGTSSFAFNDMNRNVRNKSSIICQRNNDRNYWKRWRNINKLNSFS